RSSSSWLLISPVPLFLLHSLFFAAPAPTELSTLSLHDALPILRDPRVVLGHPLFRYADESVSDRPEGTLDVVMPGSGPLVDQRRSEEHTSELQSRVDLVCRLLLEKKKKKQNKTNSHNTKRRNRQ